MKLKSVKRVILCTGSSYIHAHVVVQVISATWKWWHTFLKSCIDTMLVICISHNTVYRYVSCLFLYQTILIKWLKELCLVFNIFQVLQNGNLVFPPFRAEDYRQEVHAQVYVCLARNSVGSIHSRDVNVRAGEVQIIHVEELKVEHLLHDQQILVYPSQQYHTIMSNWKNQSFNARFQWLYILLYFLNKMQRDVWICSWVKGAWVKINFKVSVLIGALSSLLLYVVLCRFIYRYQCVGGTSSMYFLPWRWKLQVTLKQWYNLSKYAVLHAASR